MKYAPINLQEKLALFSEHFEGRQEFATLRIACTMRGPKVILGTKCPSMTSR